MERLINIFIISALWIQTGLCQNNSFLPTPSECGQVSLSVKIVGGKPARVPRYPWMAALGKISSSHFTLTCGGSLISDRYVLSAAHCLRGTAITHARLGEYDLFTDYDEFKHHDYAVVEVKKHDFVVETGENDIALLKLDRPAIKNDYIKPGCLPFNLGISSFRKRTLTAVGWGRIKKEITRTSQILKFAPLPVLRLDRCKKRFSSFLLTSQEHICAGTEKTSVCKGDSGGPLHYLNRKTGKLTIVGITSIGACGTEDTPAIFVRVSKFLDWIEENVDA